MFVLHSNIGMIFPEQCLLISGLSFTCSFFKEIIRLSHSNPRIIAVNLTLIDFNLVFCDIEQTWEY